MTRKLSPGDLIVLIATTDLLADKTESDPKCAQKILREMYNLVFKQTVQTTMPLYTCYELVFLSEYFNHSGDWKKMRACLVENIDIPEAELAAHLSKAKEALLASDPT